MKTATLIARILLGLTFVVFGLNGLLHFIPQPEMPPAAITFFGGLAAAGYMLPLLFGTQIVGGVLLLVGMVPLGLLLLAPVIVNIVGFHLFVSPDGLGVALVVAVLELFLAWVHRDAFRPLLSSSASFIDTAHERNVGVTTGRHGEVPR
jgi:uncharacterized membrane protein YphA (DoxX/SURF4 family)